MGVVYRALDPAIGRTIAIKTIRLNDLTDSAERERLRERLFREAQSAGMLSHPNIVTIYDILEEGGMAYVFMEFVNGPPLENLLGSKQSPDKTTLLSILRQTAGALDYAHKKGIVHRDIKPANVMIHDDGSAKITDFGVAKIVSQQMTQTGMMMGTPSYMSPEQIQGTEVSGAADQFALAVIAFEMLTGEKPFVGEHLPSLLYRICREEPVAAKRINPTLDGEVDVVLRKALAKDAKNRFENCSQFIAELERACNVRRDWLPLARGSSQNMMTVNASLPESTAGAAETVVTPLAVAHQTPLAETIAAPIPAPKPAAPESKPAPMAPPPPPPLIHDEPAESHLVRNLILAVAPVLLVALGFVLYRNFASKQETTATAANQRPAAEAPVDKPAPTPARSEPSSSAAARADQKTDIPSVEEPKPPLTVPAHSRDGKPETPVIPAKTPAGDDIIARFLSSPAGARITVDNNQSATCVTPCSLPLPVGRHSLIAKADGYRDASKIFDLPSEASVALGLEAAFGTLGVSSSPPGATILLNGQPRAEKTPAVLKLAPGSYKLQVVSGAVKTDEETVTIRDGVLAQRRYTVE